MTIKTAIINGTPFLSAVGVKAGAPLGNTSKMTAAITTDRKELPNYQGGGGNDDVFEQFKSGTLSLSARHVSIATLELALGGTATTVPTGAVADEVQTVVALDVLIDLDTMQDMSASMTVKDSTGTTTYVEGTDYIRKRAGLIPITGGTIAALDVLKISYTTLPHQRIQALVNLLQEKRVLFDGVNERSGKPWQGVFHRVKFGPAKSIEFIGQDFVSFDVEGEILKDDSITGVGLSQFYEVLVGDL